MNKDIVKETLMKKDITKFVKKSVAYIYIYIYIYTVNPLLSALGAYFKFRTSKGGAYWKGALNKFICLKWK